MGEEWWSSVQKGGYVWVTHFEHKGGKGPRCSGGKEQNSSSAGEEGYAAFCVGCEGNERNGMRHL